MPKTTRGFQSFLNRLNRLESEIDAIKMPQALSKCRRPSHDFTSGQTCGDGLKDKKRIRCNRKRFGWQWKTGKAHFVPVVRERAGVPQEEDWEKEIEEAKEKEMPNITPYDAEEELKVALSEMSLYSVPCAPRPGCQHYSPSTHHTPPVKWIRYFTPTVTDQFADVED